MDAAAFNVWNFEAARNHRTLESENGGMVKVKRKREC